MERAGGHCAKHLMCSAIVSTAAFIHRKLLLLILIPLQYKGFKLPGLERESLTFLCSVSCNYNIAILSNNCTWGCSAEQPFSNRL